MLGGQDRQHNIALMVICLDQMDDEGLSERTNQLCKIAYLLFDLETKRAIDTGLSDRAYAIEKARAILS